MVAMMWIGVVASGGEGDDGSGGWGGWGEVVGFEMVIGILVAVVKMRRVAAVVVMVDSVRGWWWR